MIGACLHFDQAPLAPQTTPDPLLSLATSPELLMLMTLIYCWSCFLCGLFFLVLPHFSMWNDWSLSSFDQASSAPQTTPHPPLSLATSPELQMLMLMLMLMLLVYCWFWLWCGLILLIMPFFNFFMWNDWSWPSFRPSPLGSTNHPTPSAVIGNISRATDADANATGLLLISIVVWIDFLCCPCVIYLMWIEWSWPSFWPSPLSSKNHHTPSAVIGNISRATDADANTAGLLLILIVVWIDFFDDAPVFIFWCEMIGASHHFDQDP